MHQDQPPVPDPRFDVAARLAALEARVAKLEAQKVGAERDETLSSAEAATYLGYSIHGLYRLLERDEALTKCYFRAPGGKSHLRFSRIALENYKAART
ncbi:MAG TPA: hypothetical protein VHF22_02050 [Planctomycetota bacterium]|nr:hypothetical protein [Planctomycetota bacterium]